jgi:hypothetical protein
MEELLQFLSNPTKYAYMIQQSKVCAYALRLLASGYTIEGFKGDVDAVRHLAFDFPPATGNATLTQVVKRAADWNIAPTTITIVVGGGALGRLIVANIEDAIVLDRRAGATEVRFVASPTGGGSDLPGLEDYVEDDTYLQATSITTTIPGRAEEVTSLLWEDNKCVGVVTSAQTYRGNVILCDGESKLVELSNKQYVTHRVWRGACDASGFYFGAEGEHYAVTVYAAGGVATCDSWWLREDAKVESRATAVLALLTAKSEKVVDEQVLVAATGPPGVSVAHLRKCDTLKDWQGQLEAYARDFPVPLPTR